MWGRAVAQTNGLWRPCQSRFRGPLTERDMQRPLMRSDLAQTVQRKIDAFPGADSGGTSERGAWATAGSWLPPTNSTASQPKNEERLAGHVDHPSALPRFRARALSRQSRKFRFRAK